MNKRELIARLETERAALNRLIEPLDPARLVAADQSGRSIRDVLAGLALRGSRMVTLLFSAERGRQPPEIELILRESGAPGSRHPAPADDLPGALKDRPLDLVLSDYHGAHRQLLRRLAAWDEAALFDSRKYRWTRGCSIADLLLSQVADQDAAGRAIITSLLQRPQQPAG